MGRMVEGYVNIWTDGVMDKLSVRSTEGQKNGWVDVWMIYVCMVDRWLSGQTGWMHGWVDGWMDVVFMCSDGWMSGWIRWIGVLVVEWADKCMIIGLQMDGEWEGGWICAQVYRWIYGQI